MAQKFNPRDTLVMHPQRGRNYGSGKEPKSVRDAADAKLKAQGTNVRGAR